MRPDIRHLILLLMALGAAFVLHVSHLAPWITALILAFGIWRYIIEQRNWQLPKTVVLMLITVLAALGILLTYRSFFGRDASVALLCVMLTLKLMEAATRRDFILLTLAGYFLSASAFLFNQSLLIASFMLLPLGLLTANLLVMSYPHAHLAPDIIARKSISMLAQSIPFMLILFVLFPRIPGPLWGIPQDAYSGMSGLADSMQPGQISSLTLSGKTAFRAEFKGAPPPTAQLYWRGPVLWHYDGSSWTMRAQTPSTARELIEDTSEITEYAITLEPHNRKWLLMLDMPQQLPENAFFTGDKQVLTREPVRTRIRYQVSSALRYKLAPQLDSRSHELALQLNDDANPKAFALAQQWAKLSPSEIVQSALQYYRNEQFNYTLSPPLLNLENPVDDFLFNSRRGFCEHYASSFVFLMRAAGVPARVVTGYQGGEYNPVGNYMIVRQSDAHAWAEVWLAGTGWVRIDPTAAVSPARIEAGGMENVLPEVLPIMTRKDYPWLRKLYLNWDALNNGWNQYILGYNEKRQMDLLTRILGSKADTETLLAAMLACTGLLIAVSTFFLLHTRRAPLQPVQKLYLQFQQKLKPTGLIRNPHEGAQDFSKRAVIQLPHKQTEIETLTELYMRIRYQSHCDTGTMLQFKNLVKAFKL